MIEVPIPMAILLGLLFLLTFAWGVAECYFSHQFSRIAQSSIKSHGDALDGWKEALERFDEYKKLIEERNRLKGATKQSLKDTWPDTLQ